MSEKLSVLEDNPLLFKSGLPCFDLIEAQHVVPAVEALLQEMEASLSLLEENAKANWNSLMEPLEKLEERMGRTLGPISHLKGVKDSQELRAAWQKVESQIVAFGLRKQQSTALFSLFKEMRDGAEWEKLDQAQKRIIEKRILHAELSGVGLKGKEKERFNEIQEEQARLSTQFGNNVLDATKAYALVIHDTKKMEGVPHSGKQLLAQAFNLNKGEDDPEASPENGPWRVTLDIPPYLTMMKHCKDREIREELYRAYVTRASEGENDNTPLITEILALRDEEAKLLGYESFAAMSLATKMADSVSAVDQLSEDLRVQSWEPAGKELEEIRKLARDSGETVDLEHWDIAFWSERLREKLFDFTEEELRPYFQLPKVLQGFFDLAERLFSVRIHLSDEKVPLWHPDAAYYLVEDLEGRQVASFYLDPYSRPADKRGGAWMGSCLSRISLDGELQLPVAYVVCNGTPPVGGQASLLTFREVETLFHEFGHALQHMLTTIDYGSASGISGVEWDAVELPSQFMENWCYHKPTLLGLTAHVETGKPIPDELFEKVKAARTFQAGMQMLRQLQFGMVDIELHHRFDAKGKKTPFEVMEEIIEKTSHLPPFPGERFLCAFSHIFQGGYAAGYYSYKWAEVLSADAFEAFEEVGLENETMVQEMGLRFRDTVLSLGGSQHPMEVFRSFRGRDPSVDALLKQYGLKA
ncbi:MAG: peptidase M3 [Waddliaceae bacterium]|nr:peptidase M3 [Waddliaceae bacterium]